MPKKVWSKGKKKQVQMYIHILKAYEKRLTYLYMHDGSGPAEMPRAVWRCRARKRPHAHNPRGRARLAISGTSDISPLPLSLSLSCYLSFFLFEIITILM